VQTVILATNNVNLALHKQILDLTNSHPTLLQLSIHSVTIRGDMNYQPTAFPLGGDYSKVVIQTVNIVYLDSDQGPDVKAKVCQKIFELGITVDSLKIRRSSRYGNSIHRMTHQFMWQWTEGNFNHLTTFAPGFAIAIEGNKGIQEFFLRHSSLLQLEISIRDSTLWLQWMQGSPSLTPVLEATKALLEWEEEEEGLKLILRRTSVTQPFRLTGLTLDFCSGSVPNKARDIMSRVSQVCPDLDTLTIHGLPYPGGAYSPIAKDLVSFFGLVFSKLSSGDY